MSIVRFDAPEDDYLTLSTWGVAVYSLERIDMGPEEGGWTWDRKELVAVATAEDELSAARLAEELERGEYANRGRPLHSVNFGRGVDAAYALFVIEPREHVKYNNDDTRPTHYE